MKPNYYVSGPHKHRNGWRVAVKFFHGDMNRLDTTIEESLFRSETRARTEAAKLKAIADNANARLAGH